MLSDVLKRIGDLVESLDALKFLVRIIPSYGDRGSDSWLEFTIDRHFCWRVYAVPNCTHPTRCNRPSITITRKAPHKPAR